ncbi:MAG TPA: hypothetical protein VFR58_11215 [Flavisolibacter sp.]|nr:hypothetical protein [Flavisolibacter sp.]
MIVFSTFLEVNGKQTLYSVYKNGKLAFFNPARVEKAPILFATLSESSWQIKGTNDFNLVEQVIREIGEV